MADSDDDMPLGAASGAVGAGKPPIRASRAKSAAIKDEQSDGDASDDDLPLGNGSPSRSRSRAKSSGRSKRSGKKAQSSSDESDESCDDDDAPLSKKSKTKAKAKGKSSSKPKAKSSASKRSPSAASARSVPQTAKKAKKEKSDSEDETKAIKARLTYGFKDGQRHKAPPPGDGTRAFYESLFEENPNSLIAIKFCIEHGILSGDTYYDALHQYKQMRFLGAYKGGTMGGINPVFSKGVPPDMLKKMPPELRRPPKME